MVNDLRRLYRNFFVTTLTFQSLDSPAVQFGVLLDCIDLTPAILNDDFEYTVAGDYVAGVNPGFGGWAVFTNQVTVISNAALAYNGSTNLLALADGTISRILPTVPGTDLHPVVCLSRAGRRGPVARREQRP